MQLEIEYPSHAQCRLRNNSINEQRRQCFLIQRTGTCVDTGQDGVQVCIVELIGIVLVNLGQPLQC